MSINAGGAAVRSLETAPSGGITDSAPLRQKEQDEIMVDEVVIVCWESDACFLWVVSVERDAEFVL